MNVARELLKSIFTIKGTRRVSEVAAVNMTQKSIQDFGYIFNKDGYLRKMDESGNPSDQSFQFDISDSHQVCQKHYEELGEAVTDYVYRILESDEHLHKLNVPEGSDESSGSFIFVSKDYAKKDKLLVLIHGSGVVRAGQWARSLIINENLYIGSQIPYIRKGLQNGYGIIVMNTNDNYRTVGGKPKKIPKSGDSNEHAVYVWEQYVLPSRAESIAIVAHSFGGINTIVLANKFQKEFEKRVKCVAFTDSVHAFSPDGNVTKYLKQISRNWVASGEPIDAPVSSPDNDVTRVSAGHRKHEMTSHSAMDSVFKFITERLDKS